MNHTARRINAAAQRIRVALIALLLVGLFVPASNAQQRTDPLEGLDRDQRRVFQAYTGLFCRQFFRYGESRFVILPNHQRNRDNSSGRSYDQAELDMTETRIVKRGGFQIEERIEPNAAEVVATAKILPDLDVGHYGYISSVTVERVLGPEEMIVKTIVLIPDTDVGKKDNALRKELAKRQKQYEDKTYRLLGFATAGLSAGDSFGGPERKGLQVAVMSTDPQHNFVLVNFSKLERIRTSEFVDVLRYVKLEPIVFIDMVRDNRERLGAKGDEASLISIYRRFYNRYQPKRVGEGPAVLPDADPVRPEPIAKDPAPIQPDASKPDQPEQPAQEPDKPDAPADNKPNANSDTPADEDDDDWEYKEGENTTPEQPNFFGIPF